MAEGHQSNTTLGIKDLNTVLSKLSLFPKDKWESFGLEAGLYDPTLSAIEADHPRDVEGCFRECLSYWLKRRDGVDEEGIPTWLRLGDILEEMGEKDLADKIRKQDDTNKPVYVVPYLKKEYSDINDQFSLVLNAFAEEVKEKKFLDKFKEFLLGRPFKHPKGKEEVMKECNSSGLISLLRKYFHPSDFDSLVFFAGKYNLDTSKRELSKFSQKINKLYRKILAKDFAQQAIEDHEKKEYHGEVLFKVFWSLNTTVDDFQLFLADAFHRHGFLISLRVVQQSVLTFVCTIPKWLVEEMKKYVTKNEKMLKSKKVVELIIDGTVMFSIKSKTIETAGEYQYAAAKLSHLSLSEQEEFRRSVVAMLATASSGEEEEGKPDHSLEDIKRKLIIGSFYLRELEDIIRPSHFMSPPHFMHPPDFMHYFIEFIHTSDEYAELESKVHYHPDIFGMYHRTIENCQSYSEVKKFCNLFLKVLGYAYIHHHHHESMLHHIAHELKREWEEVLGGEPLVDIDEIFFPFKK